MSTSPTFDARSLLAEVSWVRALARRLVQDDDQAEDLVQETMTAAMVAMRRRDAHPRSLRAWLGGVLRNVTRTERRRNRRRVEREASVSRSEETPATAELIERASVLRSLVGVLLELEEPYKTTLLLRFFDELPPDAIAHRMGVTESTVATRVSRGLARMRERLNRRHRGAGTWLTAILPLQEWTTRTAEPVLKNSTAAILMSTQTKLLLSIGAVVGTLVLYRAIGLQPEPSRVAVPSGEAPGELSAPDPLALGQALATGGALADQRKTVTTTPATTKPAERALVPALMTIHGRVIDLEGRGVASVRVHVGWEADVIGTSTAARFDPPEEIADLSVITDANGGFVLEVLDDFIAFAVGVDSDVLTTVLAGGVRGDTHPSGISAPAEEELLTVVGWRLPLGGRVVDEDGNPIEGAHLTVSIPQEVISALGVVLDRSTAVRMEAESGAGGAFAFTNAAEVPGGYVGAYAPGYQRWIAALPSGGDEHLEVVLRSYEVDPSKIVGEVLLPDGNPATEALVSVGAIAVATDEAGRFLLDPTHPAYEMLAQEELLTIHAVQPGYAPAARALPSLSAGQAGGWPERLVLELGHVTDWAIEGTVVDSSGAPLPATVHLLDPTPFGQVAGDSSGTMFFTQSVEQVLAGRRSLSRQAAAGRFRFEGLLDHAYRIEAFDPETMVSAIAGPFEPGETNARIVLDTNRVGVLAGRLIDAAGVPVAGVRVTVSKLTKGVGFRFGGADTSDEQGAFRIEGTAFEGVTLSISGDEIVPEIKRALPEDADLEALELVVWRRCHVQMEWSALPEGAEVRALDADGDPLDMIRMRGNSWGPVSYASVSGDRSEVYVVPDNAAWLQVVEAGEELRRVPLKPVAGEVVRVEF